MRRIVGGERSTRPVRGGGTRRGSYELTVTVVAFFTVSSETMQGHRVHEARHENLGGSLPASRAHTAQDLDHPNVDVLFEQMGGEAVPQRMWRDPPGQSRPFGRHVAYASTYPLADDSVMSSSSGAVSIGFQP
jgi:hypothetical protein